MQAGDVKTDDRHRCGNSSARLTCGKRRAHGHEWARAAAVVAIGQVHGAGCECDLSRLQQVASHHLAASCHEPYLFNPRRT